MPHRNEAAENDGNITREQAENDFRKALKLFAGRGRRYSVKQVATGSCVPERTLECFLGYSHGHPDYRPLHWGHQLSLIGFLGAEFTAELIGTVGQGAFDLPEEDGPPPMRAAIENASDNANLLNMAADGIQDHERRAVGDIGRRAIMHGQRLVAVAAGKVAA